MSFVELNDELRKCLSRNVRLLGSRQYREPSLSSACATAILLNAKGSWAGTTTSREPSPVEIDPFSLGLANCNRNCLRAAWRGEVYGSALVLYVDGEIDCV